MRATSTFGQMLCGLHHYLAMRVALFAGDRDELRRVRLGRRRMRPLVQGGYEQPLVAPQEEHT